jgi:hypothetical protein
MSQNAHSGRQLLLIGSLKMNDSAPFIAGLKNFVYRCKNDHLHIAHGEWRSERNSSFGFGDPPAEILCIERLEDGSACGLLSRFVRDDTPIAQ